MPDPFIAFRPMTVADIDATGYIRKAALEGLMQSQNVVMQPWMPRRFPHFEHLLGTDAGGAHVAVADGTVVGYAMGFTRGDIWFLAQLFVQPEVHSLGLGAELLERAMDDGRRRGARVFSVVSSTSHVAQALYMRAGMFGIGIGYQVHGPVAALTSLPAPRDGRAIVVDNASRQDGIDALDRAAFGAARAADHTLYRSGAYTSDEYAFALTDRGDTDVVAYGYASDDGHIGPVAGAAPADQLDALRVAGDWLTDRGASEARAFIISTNQAALGALLRGGWRLRSWTFLLANEPFGQFDRYIPSSGLLL